MAIVRWRTEPNPFGELDRLRRQVDRLFNDFVTTSEPFVSRAYPALNVSEDAENFYVRSELPGVHRENLDVSVVEGSMVIRGERKISPEQEGMNYHRREREGGVFRRILNLPERVDPAKVSAGLKNGILTVTLAKAEEAKPRKIGAKAS